jgi:hypothetical protein
MTGTGAAARTATTSRTTATVPLIQRKGALRVNVSTLATLRAASRRLVLQNTAEYTSSDA